MMGQYQLILSAKRSIGQALDFTKEDAVSQKSAAHNSYKITFAVTLQIKNTLKAESAASALFCVSLE